jgi:hypothetical protein
MAVTRSPRVASRARKDGTRRRTYTCKEHMHGAGACSVLPFDADEVERMVLGGLDKLVNAGSWAQALLAGREAERTRLAVVVEEATKEAADCERAIEQLASRYDAAVEAGDQAEIDLAKRAWTERRKTAERAGTRQQAAEDALAGAAEQAIEDDEGARAQMWQALSGDLDAVRSERAALNAALRRWFSDFVLGTEDDGELCTRRS